MHQARIVAHVKAAPFQACIGCQEVQLSHKVNAPRFRDIADQAQRHRPFVVSPKDGDAGAWQNAVRRRQPLDQRREVFRAPGLGPPVGGWPDRQNRPAGGYELLRQLLVPGGNPQLWHRYPVQVQNPGHALDTPLVGTISRHASTLAASEQIGHRCVPEVND